MDQSASALREPCDKARDRERCPMVGFFRLRIIPSPDARQSVERQLPGLLARHGTVLAEGVSRFLAVARPPAPGRYFRM
jgi:hypothetical protein